MDTGFTGTFVVPWSQTELDGRRSAPVDDIRAGAVWSWTGAPVRVDGPSAILPLGPSRDMADLRKRAAPAVRRILAGSRAPAAWPPPTPQDPLFTDSFDVTDGYAAWTVTLVPRGRGRTPLLMFHDALPPRDTDLWIVRHDIDIMTLAEASAPPHGVICFTPGTMILTPEGPRDVASLVEGCRVQTRDNGPAEVLWIGRREVTGARLRAMPDLAPIRLRTGALDNDVPDAGLLVSPDHRLVLRGPRARALFNTEEVLVMARDLVDDALVLRDHGMRRVTYIHMMLAHHQIVFANNVATESFHPASAALSTMGDDDRDRMFSRLPALRHDIDAYGGHARRVLTRSEAVILCHDAGRRV
ncbi:Hint domain-containing protein [Loktanella atrilutea]|uniref:Hint domain-containing protein n=1 Tax=Loktanella atrilutea TaxID=366533 RepID=A0A1M4X292_LOKAT|nr:Hint domain-containing protein [Loktanella atrilutea]SHE87621.1 Hint domain-containing protein [Loktanella atrilutea]